MSAIQFLSTLPALLGLTGFVIYYFVIKNQGGDRVTLDIITKLRQSAPQHLPPNAEKIDVATLVKLIENDTTLRGKINDQDFKLLNSALSHQFITSIVVYIICAILFIVGAALYVYISIRPVPLALSSISVQSTNEKAQGLPVDLDDLKVQWASSGEPEDVSIALEDMASGHRTTSKSVRSTEGHVEFEPDEFKSILTSRQHNGKNRLRAVFQSSKASFVSPEFDMMVGVTILAVHIEPLRIKLMGMIDNIAVDNYSFEAKFLVWAKRVGKDATPITYGGQIEYGHNDVMLDATLTYDWSTTKLVYFGPDDQRVVRTELLGFL